MLVVHARDMLVDFQNLSRFREIQITAIALAPHVRQMMSKNTIVNIPLDVSDRAHSGPAAKVEFRCCFHMTLILKLWGPHLKKLLYVDAQKATCEQVRVGSRDVRDAFDVEDLECAADGINRAVDVLNVIEGYCLVRRSWILVKESKTYEQVR